MNIEILRARLADIDSERRSIHIAAGENALDETQQNRWEELDAEESTIRSSIAELEAELESRARVAESRAKWNTLQVGTVVPTDDVPVRSLSSGEVRDRSLKRLDSRDHADHLDGAAKEKVEHLLRTRSANMDGVKIGRALLASETDAYRSAFMKAVQGVAAFTPEEARAVDEFRAASLTDAAGGYGVPVLIDPTIVLTGQGSLNPFRRISRVVTITNDEWKGVSSAGVSWSYDGEAGTVSDDAPTLAQPTVTAYKAQGFIPFSIEIGMDYPAFREEMGRLLAEAYDELQASAFATGSGSSQPFGILTALDANTNVEVVVTTDGSFGAVDVNKVWGALPDRFKANATWVMNHDVGNEVSSFSTSGAGSYFTVTLADGNAPRLKGRPVEFASYFPDFTGTTGAANILVVGDFRNYLIVDRAGMSVEVVPHLFDVTYNRPTGQRGLFAWARHGADSINDLGFRLLQNQ